MGKIHALKYRKELEIQIKSLRNNPHMFRTRNDILPEIRIRSYKGTRIIYTIQESKKIIAILAILGQTKSIIIKQLKKRKTL